MTSRSKQIWLTIIYSRVSSSTNLENIPTMHALMVACLLDNIPLNVVRFVLMDIRHYRNKKIMFPLLITKLYRRSRVDAFPKNSWVSPKTLSYLLKIRGEGVLGKSNKRKVDLGRSVDDNVNSCRQSVIGPIDEISVKMRAIKELVSKPPQEPEESSTIGHSYIAWSDYEKFLED